MKINFDEVKTIKKIGAGMYGTTYLASYNNKQYTLKIQHILSKDRVESYKNQMWREIDLYQYINKLKPDEQQFFVKLYGYQIYDNCNHIQERSFKLSDENSSFSLKLKKLDSSKWCLKYLIDYLGNTTLEQYLIKNYISVQKKIIFILQIIKIVLTLYKGGYSHGDLHLKNIMVTNTNKKYFMLNNYKIPFNGIQLVAIDYGEVINEKFGINYKKDFMKKIFVTNKDKYIFHEIFLNINPIYSGFPKRVHDCEKYNKKLPWEQEEDIWSNGLKNIMNEYPHFFNSKIVKYSKLFPESKSILQYIFDNKKDMEAINNFIKHNKNTEDFYYIISRIYDEFCYYYPNEYTNYFKWCAVREIELPEKYFLELSEVKNYNEIINVCVNILGI